MAYALLAGLPAQVGLYASIVPLLLYGIFGTSRTLSVAPVAIDSLLTATALSAFATIDSPNYVALALLLACMIGVLQVLMGIARLGFLVNFLSQPVLSGFTTAAAMVIATSQLKHVLGITIPNSEQWITVVQSLLTQLVAVNPYALLLSGISLFILLFFRDVLPHRLKRTSFPASVHVLLSRPGPLLVLLLGIGLVAGFQLDRVADIKVVGAIPVGLPPLTIPTFSWKQIQGLFPAALTIALIAYMEAISVGKSLASKRRQSINPDQELVALGLANIGASFTGGYPVTGGLSRSIVNFSAGAQTGMASIVTALFIALTTLFFTPSFYYLPQAILATIVLVAITQLFDFRSLFTLWHYSKADAFAWLITFLLVLGVNVQTGILAGVCLSLVLYLYRTSKPHVAVVGRVGTSEIYRNILRHPVFTCPHVLAVRVDESLYFPNTKFLEATVLRLIAEKPAVKHFVLIGTAINFVDASALDTLEALVLQLRDAGVTFHLAAMKGPVMDRLYRVGFLKTLGIGEVFLSTHDAMIALNCVAPIDSETPAIEKGLAL